MNEEVQGKKISQFTVTRWAGLGTGVTRALRLGPLVFVVSLLATTLSGCGGANATSGQVSIGTPAPQIAAGEPSLVFVQAASSGSIVSTGQGEFTVTLQGVQSTQFLQTQGYGSIPTSRFVDEFSAKFPDSGTTGGPGAVLEYRDAQGQLVIQNLILSAPTLRDGALRYTATTGHLVPSRYSSEAVEKLVTGDAEFQQATLFAHKDQPTQLLLGSPGVGASAKTSARISYTVRTTQAITYTGDQALDLRSGFGSISASHGRDERMQITIPPIKGAQGRWRIESMHPGVETRTIQDFEFAAGGVLYIGEYGDLFMISLDEHAGASLPLFVNFGVTINTAESSASENLKVQIR